MDPRFSPEIPRPHASESLEREAALRRGRERSRREGEEGASARHALWQSNPAFAALAENVRGYAVFLLDPNGTITFWGEGAHLMKWWTREEAEGAHLRLLYPEGGSGDGTAEEHLRQAESDGEYNGEGERIRRDGSTFLAGVTLTALRDPQGELIGFVKVTRDLSARRAAEASLTMANAAHAAREVAQGLLDRSEAARAQIEETAEFASEQARGARRYITEILEPELKEERARRAALEADLEGRTEAAPWESEQG